MPFLQPNYCPGKKIVSLINKMGGGTGTVPVLLPLKGHVAASGEAEKYIWKTTQKENTKHSFSPALLDGLN